MERPARTQGGVVMGFLIHSGTLVCMDQAGTVARGDLLVRDGKIAALGPAVGDALAALPPAERPDSFDATGALVVPGLIQGHLHLCQTLFRGMAEQPNLLRWLTERIWPLEAAHTEASLAASARLGLLELVASGVSCVHDMGTVRHTETIGVVLEQTGVRAIFGKALMDQGVGVPAALIETPAACLAEARALARRFQGAAGGRLAVSLAPRFVLAASTRLWEAVAAESQASSLLVHTHLAESMSETRAVASAVSTTAARYLAQRGLMTERLVAAHGVWLDLEELMLVEGARASLVHCPGSNLKLGSGIAALGDWLRLDLKRGLGSDGAACNNRLDLFHEMGLAAGLARVRHPERPPTARAILALATSEGARALGLDQVGSLEVGKQADVAVVDVRGPHHGPAAEADPYTALVHAARASDVRLTLVAGRVLYRDGSWTTLDPDTVRAEARAEARGLARRAELSAAA
ncbi:MAG: N-ethylammeline chlorohydrolase [Candidatus Eisenbacteria bacterium]|uniref:N-ethylammeline chlorohydrolase n=1 Tax=Eiseniibacteriota bacterium TaxID=2212470 RepID=A0A538TW14_UNCEI|nr:MAG: N-ethylammeline chlorohydrolase [Candidatus Eisenbacteria bacterium]